MQLFIEIVREILHEVTTRAFLIEFVQGSLLVAMLVLFVPRMLWPRLADRRARIQADLDAATTADDEYARSEREAARIVSRARREARRSVREAKARANAQSDEAMTVAEREASETIERTRQTVETEKAAVTAQICDEMVGLVTVIARRFLDEALTESERRALTEKIVLSSLESMDSLSV